jgi:hypothetical protein
MEFKDKINILMIIKFLKEKRHMINAKKWSNPLWK